MPQIQIKSANKNNILKISKEMIDELQKVIGCPREYFSIECIDSTFIMDGEFVTPYPVVNIAWFDRGQQVQDTVAVIITKYFEQAGYSNVDIIFTVLKESSYYENGSHF